MVKITMRSTAHGAPVSTQVLPARTSVGLLLLFIVQVSGFAPMLLSPQASRQACTKQLQFHEARSIQLGSARHLPCARHGHSLQQCPQPAPRFSTIDSAWCIVLRIAKKIILTAAVCFCVVAPSVALATQAVKSGEAQGMAKMERCITTVREYGLPAVSCATFGWITILAISSIRESKDRKNSA